MKWRVNETGQGEEGKEKEESPERGREGGKVDKIICRFSFFNRKQHWWLQLLK